MRRLSLRRNFLWTLAGNVVYAGCQWGMLVVLARMTSAEEVGRFSLGLAVCAPIFMFTGLSLRAVQSTDARGENTFAEFLGLRLATTTLALLAVGVISVAAYGGSTMLVIMLVAAAKAFESVSDVIYGLHQQRERMNRIGQSMMLRGVSSLALMAAVLAAGGGLVLAVAAMAACWAAVLLSFDTIGARRMLAAITPTGGEAPPVGRERISRLARLAWTALPLGVVMMLISLNTNIPRYFLERIAGEAQLGVFAALAYVVVGGNMLVMAMGQTASPRLARHWADGQRRRFIVLLLKLGGLALMLGAGGVLLVALFGREIATWIYGPEYGARADVFLLLMISGAVAYMGSVLGTSLTAMRRFRVQPVIHTVVVLTTASLCLALVGEMGMRGAALALIAAAGLKFLAYLAIVVHGLASGLPARS